MTISLLIEFLFFIKKDSDRLDYIEDPFGEIITFIYDDNGFITQVASKYNSVEYSYDDAGNLIEVSSAKVAIDFNSTVTPWIKYSYSRFGNNFKLIERSQSDAQWRYVINYDVAARVTAMNKVYGKTNIITKFVWDKDNVKVYLPKPSPEIVVYFAAASSDNFDLPHAISKPALGAKESFKYNRNGMVTEHIDALGVRNSYQYDETNLNAALKGNCVAQNTYPNLSEKSPKNLGISIQYVPDTGFVSEKVKYEIDVNGIKHILTTQKYEYSSDFEVIRFDDNGILMRYFSNKYGETVLSIDANNRASVNYYASTFTESCKNAFVDGTINGAGLLVRTVADITRTELDDICKSLGIPQFIFNDVTRIEPVNFTTRYSYNPNGEVQMTFAEQQKSFAVYNRRGATLASYTTGKGITLVKLGENFLRKEIWHQFVPGSTGYQGIQHSFFSGNYYIEHYEYDVFNNVNSVKKTDEIFDGKDVVFTYTRYPNGLVESICNPTGVKRIDTYNEHTGLLSKQTICSANSTVVLSDKYSYFPNGAVKSFENNLGELVFAFLDEFGRQKSTLTADNVENITFMDGLGRVTRSVKTKNGNIISERLFEYNSIGKLSTVYDVLGSGNKAQKIVFEMYLYDAMGNVVAKRQQHKNSWHYYLLDGIGRTIAEYAPEKDISVTIYDKSFEVCNYKADHSYKGEYILSGNVFVNDFMGLPAITIPFDTNGKLITKWKIITKHNCIGQEIQTIQLGQNSLSKEYNSLGLIVSETTSPLTSQYGEKDIVVKYSYLPSSQLDSKTLLNKALAVQGTTQNASVFWVDAPQVTKHIYDELGREISIKQPDGLIITKYYNEHSMPTRMVWTHATGDDILRDLRISYFAMGRIASISDGKSNAIIREYGYDDLGNCNYSSDISSIGTTKVHRAYDTLGHLISENCQVDDFSLPSLKIEHAFSEGIISYTWGNIPMRSKANWIKQKEHFDGNGRLTSIFLDESTTPFVTWKYVGTSPLERDIKEARIFQKNVYNSQMELISTIFYDKTNVFGQLDYAYDCFGNEIFSSTNLGKNFSNHYTYAQYMDFNSLRQLVAQNGELRIPKSNEILIRRQEVLFGNRSIQANNTTRMSYDQADNMWVQYQGRIIEDLSLNQFTHNNLSSFVSPCSILPKDAKLSQKELFELASNRETTRVTPSKEEALLAEENIYDKLGNLIQFKGTFWNGVRNFDVTWKLDFDPLGRLSTMQALTNEEYSGIPQNEKIAELFFAYDANNRRLRKLVKDYSRFQQLVTNDTLTSYIENNQAIVLKKLKNELSFKEQYLWNNGSRELLMSCLSESDAENIQSSRSKRYYFLQDRGLNTVCTTCVENGQAVMVSSASYLGFGKNTTIAKVESINSSMENNGNYALAINNVLDDGMLSTWNDNGNNMQFIELKLREKGNLSALNIWTDASFPKKFYAFILPTDAQSPRNDNMVNMWIKDAVKQGLCIYTHEGKEVSSDKPITVPLFSIEGNRIVLAWQQENATNINIREFEIIKSPNNPGSIAYAGQWLDKETNLYYQINRYKLAGSNKFISPDPIGFLDGNNLYAYAKNNPLEWQDPNGEWIHILLGVVAGAVINSGMYAIQCWITGEEFSWVELGIRAGVGAIAGGVAAATFGAVNPWLADMGMNATANIIISSASAGFASGAASGFSDTAIHTGDFAQAGLNGLKSGALGAVGGAIGGGVLSYTGASFGGTLLSGGVAGGATTGAQSAWNAYEQTGDLSEAFWAGLDGTWKGAAAGTSIAATGWGIGHATGKIQKLEKYPEELPNPRRGIMIKTHADRTDINYGDKPIEPGYRRHHIKPLNLGGCDVPSNIEYVPNDIHKLPHPGPVVRDASYGTIFY